MSTILKNHTNDESSSKRKRRTILNKFLTKTYHMLDQCPQDIASWSHGGDSFTIKDIDAFETVILPKYFNHSKYASFIRQLNFYGFNKQRSDPDLQTHTNAVRFSHESFKKGNPDLLHKIQRTTASKHVHVPPTGQMETLQQEVVHLRDQLSALENQIDERVDAAVQSIEKAYLSRVQNFETLLGAVISQYKDDFSASAFLPAISLSPTLQSAANLASLVDYVRSSRKTI